MNFKEVTGVLQIAQDNGGVLTLADLRVYFYKFSDPAIYKKLARLVKEGQLSKIKAGLYALPQAELTIISQRLYINSYISTGSVLARAMAIGSIPARRVQAVKVGCPRRYETDLGVVEHLSIKRELYFGFVREGELLWATPEKAFLDTCYFYRCGRQFSFDPFSDINPEVFDGARVREYLTRYNKGFQQFILQNWKIT